MGWKYEDIIQKDFETSSRLTWTKYKLERGLRLAQAAMEVENVLRNDMSLEKSVVITAQSRLDQAGLAFREGNLYWAEKLVEQARQMVGLE